MPYLDLSEYENYAHLVQLFLAAHPQYREMQAALREETDLHSEYFLSADMLHQMATWARGRFLITAKDARRIRELAVASLQKPQDVITLTPRVLGTPPRLQPSVLGHEMHAWLYRCAPERGAERIAFTVEAAISLLDHILADNDEHAVVRAQAQQLRDWLAEQDAP